VNEERTERRLRFRVGVFVLVALGTFLAMIYLLGARAHLFESRYTINADFTEVGGLNEGATVRLAGVQIGRVTDVHLPGQPGGKVRVAMTIGRQFADRIRKNSIARIETQGLLGDRIVEITVGTAEAPAVGPGEVIGARDPTDITQVINESAQTVKNVAALAESLRKTAETLNQSTIVEDAAAAVGGARRLTDQVGREIGATATATRDLARRLGRIVDRVEKGPGLAHALLYDESIDVGRLLADGAQTIRKVEVLAESLRRTAESVNRSQLVEDAVTTVSTARRLVEDLRSEVTVLLASASDLASRLGRVVDRVEKGPGLAHTLLYEEPVVLQKLDQLLATTGGLIARVESGQGAIGVLTSAASTEAAHRLVAAMDRLARALGSPPDAEGLLPALLFEPKYRQVLDDARDVARNLRDVSDRLAGGRGTLGSLMRDEPGDGGLRQASRDLQAAMANLRSITAKIDEGEGTLGALVMDPTIYERLSAILDGVARSRLLRSLIRGLGRDADASGAARE
jgi:phospholipid/cholesterol/gamma-HCH transport system substrate-binding protein